MADHVYRQRGQPTEHHKPFLLNELRLASLRCRLWAADIDSVGVALRADWISPEEALQALDSDARAFLGMRLVEEAAS